MSSENKTRYEVQKILADVIKSGLSIYVGSNHGFDVMEFAQASFQNADKVVLMNKTITRRAGWEFNSNPVEDDVLKRKDEWIEEQTWQFHFILKATDNPSIGDKQAEDYAQIVMSYMNGAGAIEMRNSGVSPLRIDSDSLIVYSDDSELYQKRAVFTLKLLVPKELTTTEIEIGSTVPKIKPV